VTDLHQLRGEATNQLVDLLNAPRTIDQPLATAHDADHLIDAIAHYVLQLVRLEHQVEPLRMKGLTLTPFLTPPNDDAGDAGDHRIHHPPDPRT